MWCIDSVKATVKKSFKEFKKIKRNGIYHILGYATVNLLGENMNIINRIQMLLLDNSNKIHNTVNGEKIKHPIITIMYEQINKDR